MLFLTELDTTSFEKKGLLMLIGSGMPMDVRLSDGLGFSRGPVGKLLHLGEC